MAAFWGEIINTGEVGVLYGLDLIISNDGGTVHDNSGGLHVSVNSGTINDLVNLGLANLGYADKDKALDKFNFKGDLPDIDIFTMPKEPYKIILEIIRFLSQKSINRNAHRTQILIEARAKGISSSKTTQILEKLKDNGKIYEPIKDSFKIMDY